MAETLDYSIVIPHRNRPALLQRCIDSIPLVAGLEIIIVDDCSDPTLLRKETFQGLHRPGVRVFFLDRVRGAGGARNVGLEHAKGHWLIFADSDDFFTPACRSALERHRSLDADIVFFKLRSVDLETGVNSFRADASNRFIDESQASGNFDRLKYQHSFPVGKLIRRTLVEGHHIRFEEVPNGNDVFFSLRTGEAAQTIKLDMSVFYVVTTRAEHTLDKTKLRSYSNLFDVAVRKVAYLRPQGAQAFGYPMAVAFWVKIYRCKRAEGLARLRALVVACGVAHTARAIARPILLDTLEAIRCRSPLIWRLLKGLRTASAGILGGRRKARPLQR